MTARRVALLAAVVTAAAAGWYVFVYLTRWEWNRAVVAGVIFLAAEIAIMGLLVLDRLAQMSGDVQPPARPDATTRERLRAAPPGRSEPFAWLSPTSGQLSVFVPVLLGAGVVLSGVAWAVERLARFTAGPAVEEDLARRLDSLALPPGGLIGDDGFDDPFAPT